MPRTQSAKSAKTIKPIKDSRTPAPTKLTIKNLLLYLLRIFIGIGRGSYFGFSVLELFFGIFFGKLTGIIGSIITGIFALFWTGSFVGMNVHTEQKEQSQEKKQRAGQQKLQAELMRIKEQNEQVYKNINDNIEQKRNAKKHSAKSTPKKMLRKSGILWEHTKNVAVHIREFFNASKDITKAILGTCLVFSIVLPVVFAKGSMLLFLSFTGFVFAFSFAVAAEYYIRRKREMKTSKIKQENKVLESQIRHFKTYGTVKSHNPNKQNSQKKRPYRPTAKEKSSNALKYVTTMLFGAMNGLYFAFTMTSLYWGIIMMPLSTSFALYVPIVLLVVSGFGHTLRHSNREYDAQTTEYKAKSRYYHYKSLWQEKVSVFKKENPDKKLPSEEQKNNMNLGQNKKPKSFIQKLAKLNFLTGRSSVEAGRAMKNSTKLILGFITFYVVPIGGSTLGFLGTFGLLPTLGLLTFAGLFAALSIGIFLWQNQRSSLKRQLETKTNYLKEDITYINEHSIVKPVKQIVTMPKSQAISTSTTKKLLLTIKQTKEIKEIKEAPVVPPEKTERIPIAKILKPSIIPFIFEPMLLPKFQPTCREQVIEHMMCKANQRTAAVA